MMSWNRYRISDICHLKKGAYATLKTEPGEFPLVVTAAFRRSASSYQFDGEAVCIPLVSSTGHGNAAIHRVHYQDGKFALANLLVGLFPKDQEQCCAKFLYYLLQSKKDQCLVPLMQGTANVTLKMKDVANVKVHLPTIDVQRSIVAKIEALASRIEEAKKLRRSVIDDAQAMLQSAFSQAIEGVGSQPLEVVAPIVRRPVKIRLDEDYPELGVRSFHNGTFFKCLSTGDQICHKKMFHINVGDLIFSNIMAWEGAIAVAQPEDDGRIGVHRFIACVPRDGIATSNFLWFYFQTAEGFSKIVEASPATIARNRTLSMKKLEKIEVPLPAFEKQLDFEKLQAKVAEIRKAQSSNQVELDALLPAILDKAFRGEL